MKVVCLCTGNGFYSALPYVANLYKALARNTTRSDWTFEVIKSSKWPTWWGKMDLFPAKERTIYMDLDTVICGNVDFLFEYEGDFCVRANPWPNSTGRCDASLFSMAKGFGEVIASDFFSKPTEIIANYRSDQEFLAKRTMGRDTWQEFAPGKTASYKADALEAGPNGASMVAFHGSPKPHEIKSGWVLEHWR